MKVSYGKNVYGKDEINAVINQLRKTTQMGLSVSTFEKKISKYFGKKYGLMVNSGSSAITLALEAINLKKGDEVIVPCLNFGTALSAMIKLEIIPILVDIDIETLQIDIDKIENSISKKTKALMIPNLIGNVPDWIKISKIAKKYKLKIIEDSADTLGATINNKPTGRFADISITSFYGSHLISCGGNGGIMMTNNKKYFLKAKVLRSWGRMSSLLKNSEDISDRLSIKLKGVAYDKKFVFSEAGYNFEPSEIGASFGLAQLKKLKIFLKLRNRNFNLHKKFFEKYNNLFITPNILNNIKTNFLAYPIILKKNKLFDRKKIQIYLEKNNIQTRPIFSGNILRHPAFKNIISKKNKISKFKNSDYIMKNGILIGCHQGLNLKEINFIHRKIENLINK
jgi:CDP-6-deoxy-D-xylo-4-hexulose-3-dehydrase